MSINDEILVLKQKITNLCIAFNTLSKEQSKDRRLSKNMKIYKEQKNNDRMQINSIRNNALSIFDECNKILRED